MRTNHSPELREIAREVADITGRLTVPEINAMMAKLDMNLTEHRMIRVCLVAELEQREARFAELYAAPVKAERPSVVARVKGWVMGRFRGLRAAGAAL